MKKEMVRVSNREQGTTGLSCILSIPRFLLDARDHALG